MRRSPRLAGATPWRAAHARQAEEAYPGIRARPSTPIEDLLAADGVSRVRNYGGDLDEVFACIVRLGTGGCSFEQPLAAMQRALDGSNAFNTQVVRP